MLGKAGWWTFTSTTHQTTPSDIISTWNLPPVLSHYTERKDLTQSIWNTLFNKSKKATVQLVGLSGLGGSGKTTLATEAIQYPKKTYNFRGWFRSDNPEALTLDYLNLGNRLHVVTPEMSDQQSTIAVKQWLEMQPAVLLVYDNAPDIDSIRDFLPHRGHIIITSQNQTITRNTIHVDNMSDIEASQLLDTLIPEELKQGNDDQHIKRLAQLLNYFPLALAQAGAYIHENKISVSRYMKFYRASYGHLLSQAALPADDHHESTHITWNLSLGVIKHHPQGQEALQLLDVMAYLDPQHVPKVFLSQHLMGNTELPDLIELEHTLRLLKRYSLVAVSEHAVNIHGLVQRHLSYHHSDEAKKNLIKKILKTFQMVRSEHRWNYDLMKSLIPHIKRFKAHAISWLNPLEIDDIDANLAWMHFSTNDCQQAKVLLEKILTHLNDDHAKCHERLISIYLDLGYINRDLGLIRQAKNCFEQALKIAHICCDQTPMLLGRIYQGLAWMYRGLGQWLDSRRYYEQALPIYQRYRGKHHIKTAHVYRGLGWSCLGLGQWHQAQDYFNQAMKIYYDYYGPYHLWITNVHRGLGGVHRGLGQLNQAELEYRKALSILEQLYQADHNWMTDIYYSLGWIYRDLGAFDEANQWFKKALSIFENTYGKKHIWTANVYRSLGLNNMDLKRWSLAQLFLKQALPVYREHHGLDHPMSKSLLRSLQKIDTVLAKQQEWTWWLHRLY